jgi:hypothetical protein
MSPSSAQIPPRTTPQKVTRTSPTAAQPSTSSPTSKMSPFLDDIKRKPSYPHDIPSPCLPFDHQYTNTPIQRQLAWPLLRSSGPSTLPTQPAFATSTQRKSTSRTFARTKATTTCSQPVTTCAPTVCTTLLRKLSTKRRFWWLCGHTTRMNSIWMRVCRTGRSFEVSCSFFFLRSCHACSLHPASFLPSCLLPSFMFSVFLSCLPYSLPRSSSVFLSCHPYAFHISLTPTRCRRGRSRPRPLRHQGMASPFRGCRGRFTLGPAGLLTARSHLHALRGYSHWQVPRIRRLEYRT